MRTCLHRLFLFLVLGFLFTHCEKTTPEPEGTIRIPDAMFLEALIASGVDTNGDGYITANEAEVIDSLNVGNSDISD